MAMFEKLPASAGSRRFNDARALLFSVAAHAGVVVLLASAPALSDRGAEGLARDEAATRGDRVTVGSSAVPEEDFGAGSAPPAVPTGRVAAPGAAAPGAAGDTAGTSGAGGAAPPLAATPPLALEVTRRLEERGRSELEMLERPLAPPADTGTAAAAGAAAGAPAAAAAPADAPLPSLGLPDTLRLGERYAVRLRLWAAAGVGDTAPGRTRSGREVRISRIRQANLEGAGVAVGTDAPALQRVDSLVPAEWVWTLTPEREGRTTLEAAVRGVVRTDSEVLVARLGTLRQEVVVVTSPWRRALATLERNWPGLVLTSLLATFLWLRERGRRRRPAQRDTTDATDDDADDPTEPRPA